MKKNTFSILIPCALVFALFSCGDKQEAQQQARPAMPYPVIEVSKQTVTTHDNFPASIEGEVNSEVRPKISGYIKEVLVHEGQAVKQGQSLFRLETQSLSQDAQAAKASVNAAQVEVNKLKPLVDKNIISSVQLETANAKLLQAQSAYNSIGANIDYANVKSPVDGFVGSINFRKGSLVSSQDPMPLTSVSSIDNVYAYFSMNEKAFISFIADAKGETSKEKLEQFPDLKLELANGKLYEKSGKIETIAGDINAQTGTITFRAKFDNKGGVLRNGSSGTILVPKTYENVLVIPAESTFERQGKSFVYEVLNDSLAAKPVTILKSSNRIYIIEDGLKDGEIILAKGLNKVSPGMKIKPMKKPLDSIINSFETVFK
ncbi:efflux RND transporter periplasmic adaptor subunit [Bizionia argentinensis JUB59]|uniref:Efflux RND transporter periplasmic adaptor subunit n=1 Tax=Bizionia argentinensis JUB59 TaxID=1046627 RepID=G2EF73_9FLAO|nr:efflux RND transporter periplasmic adaptor subunit [Bizionia argentinensis]EGV42877.1 efflux RND transporter periplasmic adaptor subunit [Bizionia argentinensis JUB59]